MIKRKQGPPPPGIVWFAILVFSFLSLWTSVERFYTETKQRSYNEGYEKGVVVANAFKQHLASGVADMLQAQNPRLYRARAEQYANILTYECERQGVGHIAITAIMMQESRLNEYATGGAGEIGLMQILPWWLEKAEALGLKKISRRELYDPANNIRWGVAIFAYNWRLTKGNLFKTLCIYNAGSANWENGKRYANSVLAIRSNLNK